jgi:hypothetical protein
MYTIIAKLLDSDGELFTTFTQEIEESYNAENFEYVEAQFNNLVKYINANFDCDEEYALSAYIHDSDGDAIY